MENCLFIYEVEEKDEKIFSQVGDKNMLFSASPLVKDCIGCFDCWIKTPSKCVIADRCNDLPMYISKAKEVIIISPILYGGYSQKIKAVLDRSIGYILPYFRIVDGEMHHQMRYNNPFKLSVYFYGEFDDDEIEIGRRLVKANAVNMGGRYLFCLFSPITGFHKKGDIMKIVMVCGSPRQLNSTSHYLLQAIKEKLSDGNDIILRLMKEYKDENTIREDLTDATSIILAFPLYVDGIPASFLGVLQLIEKVMQDGNSKCRVYSLVNNGFYDAKQNHVAIDMVWKWCDKCGFEKGYAIGVGAGGIVKMSSMGYGPNVSLGRALDELGNAILNHTENNPRYVEPNFPRFLYIMAAHSGWRRAVKKNGLKVRDLRKR